MNEFHFRKRSMEISLEGKQYVFHPYASEVIRGMNQRLQEKIKAKAPTEERLEVYADIIDAGLGQGAAKAILENRGSLEEICQDADDLLVYLMACQTACSATRRPEPDAPCKTAVPEK